MLGRIANLVGDKSTGKTLLAIEAASNFVRSYPDGMVRYCEAESAFDLEYAAAMGMPTANVSFASDITTVEDFYEDVEKTIDELKGRPCLYVVDSLDALSSRDEVGRDIDAATYGGGKAKQLSQAFRRLVQKLEASRVALLIISQIRDKVGVVFGEAHTRSGGRALDFYASQVVWLHEVRKISKTVKSVERVVGIQVRAKCKKNKIGLPFREAEFPIIFGYGVDDVTANIEWMMKVRGPGVLKDFGFGEQNWKAKVTMARNEGGAAQNDLRTKAKSTVLSMWQLVESEFLPKRGKYEDA